MAHLVPLLPGISSRRARSATAARHSQPCGKAFGGGITQKTTKNSCRLDPCPAASRVAWIAPSERRHRGKDMRNFHDPRRSAAIAGTGMAATSHPLATLAALDVLRDGGNAVDAAIAASAVLCVAEPHMTGIGGDCFVLYSPKAGRPLALDGSGRAPMKATVEWYVERGFTEIPVESVHAATVPGAVDAWFTLLEAHGSKEMAALLAPAIRLAEEGVLITPRPAFDFQYLAGK